MACSSDKAETDAGGGDDAQAQLDASPAGDSGLSPDTGMTLDAGAMDAGAVDMGTPDTGTPDTGTPDIGTPDTGVVDAGPPDTGPVDTGVVDAGPPDTGPVDTGVVDAGPADTGPADTGPADTGVVDAGPPDTGPADTGAVDAAMVDAGATDAGTPGACQVAVDLPETNAGQVGASGGSVGPFITCPAGDEVIGVAVRISDQNSANGARSAVGFTLACAALSVSATGASVGTETLQEVAGNGQFGWTPATQSTITRCPPGWLVSGLSASRGTTGNVFIDVSVRCRELLPTGALSGAVQSFDVVGSLIGSGDTYDIVDCPAGQVVRRMGTRIGAGLDAVTLQCATPACAP